MYVCSLLGFELVENYTSSELFPHSLVVESETGQGRGI